MENIPMRSGAYTDEYREIAFVLDGKNYTAGGLEHLNKLLQEGWTVKMATPFSVATIGNIQTPGIEHGRMLIVLRNGPAESDF